MARTKSLKVELTDLPTSYDMVHASKLIGKDHRTIKKFCDENNIELENYNGRYYIPEKQLNLIKELLWEEKNL